MTTLLKVTVVLLCIGLVMCGQKVGKGKKKRPETTQDFGRLFNGNSTQESDARALRKGTTLLPRAFDRKTLELRDEYRGDLTAKELDLVKMMMGLKCSPRNKVFNLSHVTVSQALQVACYLQPIIAYQETQSLPTGNANETKDVPVGIQRFLSLVCWNETTSPHIILGMDMDTFGPFVHPTLMAMLTRNVSENLEAVLPASIQTKMCDEMIVLGSVESIAAIADNFPACLEALEMVQDFPAILEVVARNPKGKPGCNDLFGMPPEFLENVPAEKLQECLHVGLWNEDTAPFLVNRLNLTAAGDALAESDLCYLRKSILTQIPKDALVTAAEDQLRCSYIEECEMKKVILHRALGANPTSRNCSRFARSLCMINEKCLRLMTAADLEAVKLEDISLKGISCKTLRDVATELQLGNISTWTPKNMQKYNKLLRCFRKMNADDISHIVDFILAEGLPDDVDFPRHVRRKIFKKVKEKLVAPIDYAMLRKMSSLVSMMSSQDIQNLSATVVGQALGRGALTKSLSRMSKRAKRQLIRKLSTDQLKEAQCKMGELLDFIPSSTLSKMDGLKVGDLVGGVGPLRCSTRFKTRSQCEVMFKNVVGDLGDCNVVSRTMLYDLTSTRAICGIPLKAVKKLPPDDSLIDIASAFFTGSCKNPAVGRMFYEKLWLYQKFRPQGKFTRAEIQELGGNFMKNLPVSDFQASDRNDKLISLRLFRKADLDDVDPDWIRKIVAEAVTALVGSGVITTKVSWSLGKLICGLSAEHVSRLAPFGLDSILAAFDSCSDLPPETQTALLQEVKKRTPIAQMTAEDLKTAGIILLDDPTSIGQISDKVLHDAFPVMVKKARQWRKRVKGVYKVFRDPNPDIRSRQKKKKKAIRQSLRTMLGAVKRIRKRQTSRVKRSSDSLACEDIMSLGDEVSILSEQDIAGLGDIDFSECLDVFGDAVDWNVDQIQSLVDKAKQVLGNVSQWLDTGIVEAAGPILLGLTPEELSNLNLGLEQIEILGAIPGWTQEQMQRVLGDWLATIRAATPSTDDLLSLGNFVCGASAGTFSTFISEDAFENEMNAVSEAVSNCTQEQLQEIASAAIDALGPVTSWSPAQTSDLGIILAGLDSTALSQLSEAQLNSIELDTFVAIPKDSFAGLTPGQIRSLSPQQAMSITEDQLSGLDAEKKTALEELGITITQDAQSGAAATGPATLLEILVVMAISILIMASG